MTELLPRIKFNIVSLTESYLNSTLTHHCKTSYCWWRKQSHGEVEPTQSGQAEWSIIIKLFYSMPKLYFLVPNHAVYRPNHVIYHTLNDWVLW